MTPRRESGHHRTAPFLARKLRAFDAVLAETIPRVQAAADAEAVHDMRVAVRRLRTLLRLAGPVFGRFHTDSVRLSFAEVQQATGDLRDEEALAETLADLHLQEPTFDSWRAARRARERALRRAVIKRIRAGELRRARRMLRALLVLPVKPSRNEPLGKFARRAVARATRTVESMRDVAPGDVEGLHALRIAYKKLRYAIESFHEVLPAEIVAMAEVAVRFQKRLGDLHDIDVALVTVGRARGLEPRVRTLVITALLEARTRRVKKYLGEMPPAEVVRAGPPPYVMPLVGSRYGRSRPS